MSLTNEELIRRCRAGEPIDELANAAEMTRSGIYDRLGRLGVAPRTDTNIDDETIRQALTDHKSINAAAKSPRHPPQPAHRRSGTSRTPGSPANIPDDLADIYRQQGSLNRFAEHYGTSHLTLFVGPCRA